jgi:hypothetical protein
MTSFSSARASLSASTIPGVKMSEVPLEFALKEPLLLSGLRSDGCLTITDDVSFSVKKIFFTILFLCFYVEA